MIVFDKDGDIQNKVNKKVDDEFLDKCRKSAELFDKYEEWSYEKARDDYIKECKANENQLRYHVIIVSFIQQNIIGDYWER